MATMFDVIRRRNTSGRLWDRGEEEGQRMNVIGLQARARGSSWHHEMSPSAHP